jgi:hypothetical protein
MSPNTEDWLRRSMEFREWNGHEYHADEAVHFAISMASTFYGSSSPQLEMIKKRVELQGGNTAFPIFEMASGAIRNMTAEIRGGLISRIRLGIAGEVLGELMTIAREALAENRLNVAAVLTAAAFEDCMRRLAHEKAGLTSRLKLEQVLAELKNKGVLSGGEPAVAQSFLKFRNDSLHADWQNVKESQVSSCLALLDSLIVKHLS